MNNLFLNTIDALTRHDKSAKVFLRECIKSIILFPLSLILTATAVVFGVTFFVFKKIYEYGN